MMVGFNRRNGESGPLNRLDFNFLFLVNALNEVNNSLG